MTNYLKKFINIHTHIRSHMKTKRIELKYNKLALQKNMSFEVVGVLKEFLPFFSIFI